ncbi:hypothetical protein AcW1_005309 [Taiwanofungus camphoratus]|nr:hypothetical protein AcW1_005309 [Antrodia cinnamomea]
MRGRARGRSWSASRRHGPPGGVRPRQVRRSERRPTVWAPPTFYARRVGAHFLPACGCARAGLCVPPCVTNAKTSDGLSPPRCIAAARSPRFVSCAYLVRFSAGLGLGRVLCISVSTSPLPRRCIFSIASPRYQGNVRPGRAITCGKLGEETPDSSLSMSENAFCLLPLRSAKRSTWMPCSVRAPVLAPTIVRVRRRPFALRSSPSLCICCPRSAHLSTSRRIVCVYLIIGAQSSVHSTRRPHPDFVHLAIRVSVNPSLPGPRLTISSG